MPLKINFNKENKIRWEKFKLYCEKLKDEYKLNDKQFEFWFRNDFVLENKLEHNKFRKKIFSYIKKNNIIRNTALNWILQDKYKSHRDEELEQLSPEILAYFQTGKTIQECAEHFNLTYNKIKNAIYNYQGTKREWFENLHNKIVTLSKKEKSFVEIAKKLNITYGTVYYHLIEKQPPKVNERKEMYIQIINEYNSNNQTLTILDLCEKYNIIKASMYYFIKKNCRVLKSGEIRIKK